MKKTFLLDTNVLMRYPNAIYGFDDNEVVVTATSIEELDNLKTIPGERGYAARNALRHIDELRLIAKEQKRTLAQGVKINNKKGSFRIENNNIDPEALPQGWDIHKADNRIIACSKNIKAILVTEDRGMSVKADELGIPVESYKNAEIKDEDGYTGQSEIFLSAKDISDFYKNGRIKLRKKDMENISELVENEYFVLRNADDPQKNTALGRYTNGEIVSLVSLPENCPVKLRNNSQRFMADMLLNDDIHLTIISGSAGTAKTFMTVVAAMQGYQMDKWNQIICTRNNVEMDSHSIGALPGDEEEKIGPLMRGFCDNLRSYLRLGGTDEKDVEASVEDYLDQKIIKFEAMSFMRGRSITDSLIFLDECQNATAHQIHSIITRAGQGMKVVCCGDPGQIDDIRLDRKNCGLSVAMEAMKGSPLCAMIVLDDKEASQRSALAADATLRMGRLFG